MTTPPPDPRHRRKLGKIGTSGNSSYYLTLPVDLVRRLGWRKGQRLVVRQRPDRPGLIVEDWQPPAKPDGGPNRVFPGKMTE
ncbi:AbrB/MazE/SpoVT family DNA-binding domain-containing protein [Candidatus Parcubacteria bacterium]|nr:AbrB/MazE/SpoVT family DNA-binding domain-containing protein [Candidatus Parcubacteria bacterium]